MIFFRRIRRAARLGYQDGWSGVGSRRVGHNTSVIQRTYDRCYLNGQVAGNKQRRTRG